MTLKTPYRAGMRRLASSVSLIATAQNDRWTGMAATAVTSVTDDPPTLLVCINRTASLNLPLRERGRFSVNVLGRGQAALTRIFADPARRETRFEGSDWRLVQGVPVLQGADASFVCDVADLSEIGTHTVVFGEIVGVTGLDRRPDPLIWFDGGCHGIEPAGETA